MTKEKIYKTYLEETTKTGKGGKPLCYTQFRNMWNTQFRDVIIPKVNVYHWKESVPTSSSAFLLLYLLLFTKYLVQKETIAITLPFPFNCLSLIIACKILHLFHQGLASSIFHLLKFAPTCCNLKQLITTFKVYCQKWKGRWWYGWYSWQAWHS